MIDAVSHRKLSQELSKILPSSEQVFDDARSLEEYSKDLSFTPAIRPGCVVRPKTGEEVRSIVGWANQTGTPLVPVSSGPPHFRGDTVPSVGGAVIVDLSGLNRIVRIDRRNKIAIVEPGVTFDQLQPELARAGMVLSMPLLPRRSKSVVTSLLEREPILIPRFQWQLLDPLRFLEVVWGNGDTLRTGEAGAYRPIDADKPIMQLAPFGPVQVDYYRLVSAAQGTMGIVMWAAAKCEVLPTVHEFFFVPSDTLNPLIDLAYKVLRVRFGDELFIMNNANLASVAGEDREEIERLKQELPNWVLVLGIAGRNRLPEERVRFQREDISGMCQDLGLKLLSRVCTVNGTQMEQLLGQCNRETPWKLSGKGGGQDIFFLTTLDRTPEFIEAVSAVSREEKYSTADIGIYLQPTQQGASCHCEFNFPFDPGNSSQRGIVSGLYRRASETLLKHDAFFSRPYGIWADMVYNRDAQTTMTLKKIKGIFDPNNIMNPGRLFWAETAREG